MAFIRFFSRGHSAVHHLAEEVVLGRSYDCDIFIPDVFVSRQHCRFEKTDRGWMVVDLGSRNGIFFNGARVKRRDLNHEDVLELGSVAFAFDDGDIETTEDKSTAMPYGQGTRITELIDTLYAGESRPAEYIRRKGRQPKAKSAAGTAFEVDNEAVTVPEEPSEWTELDLELQVAAMEAPAPRFNFLDEPLQLEAAMATDTTVEQRSSAHGQYRSDLDAIKTAARQSEVATMEAAAGSQRSVGYGGQSLWSGPDMASPPGGVPENKRRIRRPKGKPIVNKTSLHQKFYDATQEVMFRVRASPLISAGIAGALLLLVIMALYFSNHRRGPGYNLDRLSDKERIDMLNASAN